MGGGLISTNLGAISIPVTPDNTGMNKIYFNGEHILTTIGSTITPMVSKETLIRARNYLEEKMLVYHYGGEEQKGYYLPMDPKYIRSLGKLVSKEGYQEPKVDPSKKLVTVPHSEYAGSRKDSTNSSVQEYYCKNVNCEIY